MEFHEKLRELRNHRGLTQEELAGALFVSRTAVSKWEAGRGYPSIDSLKELSRYFSITIDELLSGEGPDSIAEKENASGPGNVCGPLIGILDLFSFMLMILPLYPKPVDGYVYPVSLFAYTEPAFWILQIHWALFLIRILTGAANILAAVREPYATIAAFSLFTAKGILIVRRLKTGK